MRPSDKLIEVYKPMFLQNLDLVVECFLEDTKDFNTKVDQRILDLMFCVFIGGMMQPMSPGSKFNTEYKA